MIDNLNVEALCEEKATTDITVVSAILEKYSAPKPDESPLKLSQQNSSCMSPMVSFEQKKYDTVGFVEPQSMNFDVKINIAYEEFIKTENPKKLV